MPLPDGGHEAVTDYPAATGGYVRLVERDRPLPEGVRSTQSVPLARGAQASFADIGAAQSLTWREDGRSYAIIGVRPAAPYTSAELARLADSLR